jgi:putative membrane protein
VGEEKMKKHLQTAFLTGTLLLCGFLNVEAADAAVQDEDFAMKAAAAGKKEVELGRLASRRGRSAAVKSFGRRMVTDHTMAGNRLKALAARKGITLPRELDADGRAAMDQLSSLRGREFDRAYMEMMVSDHEKALADFETESRSGADRGLRNFARQALPTLRMHLRMARANSR